MAAAVTIVQRTADPTLGGESYGYGPAFVVTVWAASTAYAAGSVVTRQGKTYHAVAPVVSRATFTPADWVQVN